MAKFKDKSSGNVFEFTSDYDIKTMRKHPDYIEVVEQQELKKPLTTKKQLKEV